MTDARRKRADGVRTLEDLRLRCWVDPQTGCWLWRYAVCSSGGGRGQPRSRVWMPDAPGNGKAMAMTAARAAWLLSGRTLPPGGVVWRTRPRCDALCICPHHGSGGTRQQMHAAMVADGRLKGDPRRAVVNAINRRAMMVPAEKVRLAEAMFASGAMQKAVCAALGLSVNSAAKIRKGLHPNSSAAQHVVANASVFAWSAAA